jgi:hypothetical protein
MAVPDQADLGRDRTIQFFRAFVRHGIRPGDLIELGPVRFPVQEHFPAAMDYAAEQGWVEKSEAVARSANLDASAAMGQP